MTIQATPSANVNSVAPSTAKTPPPAQHKHEAQQAEQRQDTVQLSAQAKAALEKQHKDGGQ